MKKCFLFAVILLAAGCFAPDPALQKEWAPADRTYDSLARQLESSQDARNGGELLAKLRTRRDQLPDNPVLGWRTRYWEARALVPQGRWDEALELLRDAERQVDPARYPYDRIRIVGLQSQIRLMRGEYPDSYRGYCETDEYYRRTGDTLRLASTCVNMGVIMQELEDWQRALDYFKAADSLFTLSGTDTYYVKNRLNFANVLYRQGERKRAVGILDTLLRTPECLADTSFRINVLLSYCSYAEGDERGGEAAEAYRLARLSDDRKLIAKSAVALAIERLQRDSAAEALPLLRQALDYVEASDDAEFLLPSLENTAHALYATGQADSAYRTLPMNPCKCGYYGSGVRECSCTPSAIERYRQRISGPLLDRIDLHVEARPVEYDALAAKTGGERSADIRTRVAAVRAMQAQRYKSLGFTCNAQLPSGMLRRYCPLAPAAEKLLRGAFERMGYSARAYDRILRVARTIADMNGVEQIGAAELMEALQYRRMDRAVGK